jgi:hypothetical protein
MTTDPLELNEEPKGERPGPSTRSYKPKPLRSLPTDRVGLDRQLVILRAYAKASAAADGQAVSNAEVAKYADLHAGSISVCNQFWNDIGLLAREGNRNRPDESVIDFDQASEWNAEKAGLKLARPLEATWFAQALTRKLALKASISRTEAVEFLAEEARAGKEYRLQLEMLLEYLRIAGLIVVEGTDITRPPRTKPEDELSRHNTHLVTADPLPNVPASKHGDAILLSDSKVERFSIPLPGKAPVVIEMPEDLDHDDWIMLGSMLAQYIRRWKKFKTPKDLTDATSGDDDLL